MDVVNETEDDVIYEVDDGGGPGGDEEPRYQVNEEVRRWCNTDATACAGYLGPGEEHREILQHSMSNLELRFFHKSAFPELTAADDLAPDSRWALVEKEPGSYRIVAR